MTTKEKEQLELIEKQKRIKVKMLLVSPKDKTTITDNEEQEVFEEMSLYKANKYFESLARGPKPTQSMYMPCPTSGYELDLATNTLKEKTTTAVIESNKRTKVEPPIV